MTAVGMALDHGDRVLSMTACNCVAGFGPEALKVWDERIAAIKANGLEPMIEPTIQRWFTQPTIDSRPDDMAAVRAMIAATPVAGYLGCCGAIKSLDYLDRLDQISLPSLFIAGTHDQGAPVTAMRDMHARVNGSRYVELDAAHVSNIERPAEFNAALGDFLRGV
jgi:3-oxoadipate enol-lactonase